MIQCKKELGGARTNFLKKYRTLKILVSAFSYLLSIIYLNSDFYFFNSNYIFNVS